jgi:hypothetical protein
MPHSFRWLVSLALVLTATVLPAAAQTPDVREIIVEGWLRRQPGAPVAVGRQPGASAAMGGSGTSGLRSEPSAQDSERARKALLADELLLHSMGVGSDGPALLKFFRKRTLTEADVQRLDQLIRQLSDDQFRAREKASAELIGLGRPVIAWLSKAQESFDPEVRKRAAACLAAIETNPGSALPAAAVRLIRQKRPEGTIAALLAYLPCALNDLVEEEILITLRALGARDGKLDHALLAALGDPHREKRSAAALVVGQLGNSNERPLVRRLLADADPKVRLRAAQGLIAGRELGAVPHLVALLADAPLDVARQAEDLLYRLAADRAPRVELDDTALARRRCRDSWNVWWTGNKDRLELTRGPDLVVLNPSRHAQEGVERFLRSFINSDLDDLRKVTELPFSDLAAGRVIRTPDALEKMLREMMNFRGEGGMSFSIRSVASYSEFFKGRAGALAAKYRRPEIRVVSVRLMFEDAQEADNSFSQTSLFFVRVGNGGQTRVIGVADEDVP